jgi:hypothetical protein
VLGSHEGQRCKLLTEQKRKRLSSGGKAAECGSSAEQEPILVLRNRAGQTTDHVLEAANKRCVREVLPLDLIDNVVSRTDVGAMLAKVTGELGIEQPAVDTSRGEHTRGASHTQKVNAPHRGLKQ